MNIKHEVSSNFIVEAVSSFFDFRETYQDYMISNASRSLKENLLDLVEECGVGENSTPSSIVDNFLVNGDFVSREDDENLWLGDADITDCDGSPMDNDLVEETKAEIWQTYCKENAIIYNNDYACLSF